MKPLQVARLKVMAAVPYIRKTESANLGYSFLSEADLIGRLHPAMVDVGLTVHPVQIDVQSQTETPTQKSTRFNVRAVVHYEFCCEDDRERVVVLAEATDTWDKASSKMMTMALKYALRQFFLLETGDDPDQVAHKRAARWDESYDRAVQTIEKATAENIAEVRDAIDGFAPDKRAELLPMVARREKELANGGG